MESLSRPNGERNRLAPEVLNVSVSGLIGTRFIQSVSRQFSLVAERNGFFFPCTESVEFSVAF